MTSTAPREEGARDDLLPPRLLDLLARAEKASEYELPGGVDSGVLERGLSAWGLRPSAQWLSWVSVCNGPLIGLGEILGVGTDASITEVADYLGRYPELLAMCLLPVAGDGFGGFWVLACEGAPSPGSTHYFDAVLWGECAWERLEPAPDSWFELLMYLLTPSVRP